MGGNIKTLVCSEIDKLTPDMIEYAKQIVTYPSVMGEEKEAQEYISSMLEKRGFEVDMWVPKIEELRHHYSFFTGSRDNFNGSPNVVGLMKGSGGGRSLIVNGHIDVVPANDLDEWSVNPFEGIVRDGKIIARGISDMKCTHAMFLCCMDAFKKLGIKLKGDLIFESVIDEETGGAGTLACILRGYKADAAIIPEPVSMKMCPAGQGVTYFKLYVSGKAFHGGARYNGVSAIEKAMTVVQVVNKLELQRKKRLAHPLYSEIPVPFTINIGMINGGEWPSMVPGMAVLEGRMGIAPNETLEEARADMEQCLIDLATIDPWFQKEPVKIEWTPNFLLSGEIPINHDLVKVFSKTYNDVLDEEPKVGGTPFGTDGGALIRFSDTPTLIFGPGNCAHCADEDIDINTMLEYAKILALSIIEWCGIEG